jgi:predicted aspartyl protease
VLISAPVHPALGACKITQLAEWPVKIVDSRPLLAGDIDGQPIIILLDTGSYRSFLFSGAARRLNLPLRQFSNREVYGAGGSSAMLSTSVQRFEIGSLVEKNLTLPVWERKGGEDPHDIGFLLGADILSSFDIEFDLAHGAIRLLQPEGCKPEQLVYWSNGYFLTRLHIPSATDPHFEAEVSLNGKRAVA